MSGTDKKLGYGIPICYRNFESRGKGYGKWGRVDKRPKQFKYLTISN